MFRGFWISNTISSCRAGERVGGNVDTVQWQAVLKSCSGFEAFRKVHTGQVTP